MRTAVASWLAIACLLLGSPAFAADQRVEEILQAHARHGLVSPRVALAQLQAARDIPGRDAPILSRSRYHFFLGLYASGAQKMDAAQAAVDELKALAATGQCEPCAAQALLVEGNIALRSNRRQAVRDIVDRLAAKMPQDPVTRMRVLAFRGGVFESIGEYDQSLEATLAAATLAQTLDRPADQARALNRMVMVNIARRDLARAQTLAAEAYALADRIGDLETMGYVRGNQAMIHSLHGNAREELRALQDVLRLTSRNPQLRDATMAAQINLSDYYLGQHEYQRSLVHAEQAEAIAIELDNPVARAVIMRNRAAALARIGRRAEGIALLQQAIGLAQQAQAKAYVLEMHQTLATLYQEGGQLREALTAVSKSNELNLELIRSQREDVVQELQEKFSAERKNSEIERLSLENARKQAQVQAQAWRQRLWAALAAILLLGATLLVQWLSRAHRRSRALQVDNALLSEQSARDVLTGAFNRRHCQALMSQQQVTLHGHRNDPQHRACVGLVLLDIDHFKQVNDTWGHAAGDAVLVEIVTRLRSLLRDKDAVVRWGGEEFVLLLPGTPADGLQTVAHRVLEAIGTTPVTVDGGTIPVTASAGCIAWPAFQGQHWEDAMHIADLALYLSKSRGRNRASCLTHIAEHADFERVRSDLAQAEASGEVVMATVLGPAPSMRVVKAVA